MRVNIKQLTRVPLRRLGYDLRKIDEKPELIDFIESRSVDLILDIGANAGQFGKLIRDKGYTGQIVSFEPVFEVFRQLASNAATDSKWQVHNIALGSNAGQISMNVAEGTEFSSINSVSRAAGEFDAATKSVRKEEVRVETVDGLWSSEWEHRNVFMKIDTQGYEQQVLAGAINSLKRLKGVQLELPIVRLYEGVWHLDEAIHFMRDVGFIPAQINVGNFHLKDAASLIEVDCVFRRYDTSVDV